MTNTHQKYEINTHLTEIPKDAVIIESTIFDENGARYSPAFESKVCNKCGDADIKWRRT